MYTKCHYSFVNIRYVHELALKKSARDKLTFIEKAPPVIGVTAQDATACVKQRQTTRL